MESTINAIFTVLGIFIAGSAIAPIYRAIKIEALLKVHYGLPSLESYTRRLTGGEVAVTKAKDAHKKSANKCL